MISVSSLNAHIFFKNLRHFENKSEKYRTFLKTNPENRKSKFQLFFDTNIFFVIEFCFTKIEISTFFPIDKNILSTPSCPFCIFMISDLPPDSQISFIFSYFETYFLDFSMSFQYCFTRISEKDPALKYTTFPSLGFSNELFVAEIFHFYC